MTQIILPNVNVTGDNLWSQVEGNDNAIKSVVNGGLDNGNIATGADISGAKLLDTSVPGSKLQANSVGRTQAKDVLEHVTGTSSATGLQVLTSINLDPGRYFVQAKFVGSAIFTVVTSGGAATLSESITAGGNTQETLLVTVTATTTLQLKCESSVSSSRTGRLYIVGMAD